MKLFRHLRAAALLCAPLCFGLSLEGLASVYYPSSIATSSSYAPSWAASALSTRTDNFDEAPVFSGGEIRFLENQVTAQQQLCGVFRSSDGHVLVVDGGVSANAPHLIETIQAYGGTVDAWLITHPQDDHVGALYQILSSETPEIEIKNIYFHFLEEDWYGAVSPEDRMMVQNLFRVLHEVPAERLHGFSGAELTKNQSVSVSECLSFRVLNDPLRTAGAYAVNNSSLMYDILMDGKHIIVLGDMGPDGGDMLLPSVRMSHLQCDYVVMSHHGQNGVRENFYRALNPKACIWSCSAWLFEADPGNLRLKTAETRSTVRSMGITRNYCTKDGDIILR